MLGFRSGGRNAQLPLTCRSVPGRAYCRASMSDLGNDPVLDRAYLVDLAPDGIADDQRFRRLESEANTPRGSSKNDIPRLEGHGLRKFGDLLPNVEDQVPGIGVLAKLAV